MEQSSVTPRQPTGLTVLGGFLGTGKTTLLNRLLASEGANGVGVIVNDFGAVSIDERLVVSRDNWLISLANGCVCCDLGENLVDALFRLREHPSQLHTVVVETSGVADPARIGAVARIGSHFRLNAIVVLVDVLHVRQHVREQYLSDTILRQICAADLLIVNKCDLVDLEIAQEVRAWLDGLVPSTPKILADPSNAPYELLLELNSKSSASLQSRSAYSSAGGLHGTEGSFNAWTFAADRGFDRRRLETVLANLPKTIIRGKGIVSFAGKPGRSVFHLVAGRWEFTPWSGTRDDQQATELVLIGIGHLPAACFDSVFKNALSSDPLD